MPDRRPENKNKWKRKYWQIHSSSQCAELAGKHEDDGDSNGAFETVIERYENKLEEWENSKIETIRIMAFLILARIVRFLETCWHSAQRKSPR